MVDWVLAACAAAIVVVGGMAVAWPARRPAQPDDDRRARDRTNRRREAELLAVSARLFAAQENERRQVARELHDDVSQRLALVSFELQRLGRIVSTTNAEAAELATQLFERTAEIATAVHDITYRLHPLKLELLGLNAAIRDMRRQLSARHGITISVAYDTVSEPLSPEVALCLFRIVEEGLANVVKHSEASQASVSVTGTGDAIVLAIVDTGVGFDPDAAGLSGLGLPGIRHRLELLGGSMRIWSHAGKGTRLEVTVPSRVPSVAENT